VRIKSGIFSNLAASGKSSRLQAIVSWTYSMHMEKILHNWTYRDVVNFLEEKGFNFYEDLEDCQSWVKLGNNGEPDRFVEIKFTREFYSPKAIQKMVRLSGVGEDKWNEWASS
jgi:hypothetical protein